VQQPRRTKSLDRNAWTDVPIVKGVVIRRASAVKPGDVLVTTALGSENVEAVYARAVLAKAEYSHTGRIRAMEDCVTPCRMDGAMQERAIANGHVGRFASPFTSDNSLLSDDLMQVALGAYNKIADDNTADWCTIAGAVSSWNGYHHSMRQLLPFDKWVDASILNAAYEVVASILPIVEPSLVFDTRLTREVEGRLLHARVQASTSSSAFHFVWGELTSKDRSDAMLRAMLHPQRMCIFASMSTGETIRLASETSSDLLNSVLRESE